MKYLYRFRYLFFLCSLAILLWGIFRQAPPPELFKQSDKLLHLIAFCGFAIISRFAFMHFNEVIVWLSILACAPLFEYLQHIFQPSRYFSEQDAVANILGVVLAWIVWILLMKLKNPRNV